MLERYASFKKASRSWNIYFDEVVKGFGFIKNEEEACVYKKESGSYVAFLILYVDDILLIRNNIPMLESVKTSLKNSFFDEGFRTNSIHTGHQDL